jgi:hypothetical protein
MVKICQCGCNEEITAQSTKYRKKNKYKQGHFNSRQIKVLPESRMCSSCKESKSIDNFYFRIKYSKYNNLPYYTIASWCNSCRRVKNSKFGKSLNEDGIKNYTKISRIRKQKHLNDLPWLMSQRVYRCRQRHAGTEPFNLTQEYLLNLLNQQNGCCYYSGEKLDFSLTQREDFDNFASLDKLEPDKGYIQGNVVWCKNLINIMKRKMNLEEFYDLLENILYRRNTNEQVDAKIA